MKTWVIGGAMGGVASLVAGISFSLFAVASDNQATQQQVTRLERQLTADQAQLAALRAKVSGTSRDLITCGDFQNMGLLNLDYINIGVDSSGNYVANPSQSVVPLPQHCINR